MAITRAEDQTNLRYDDSNEWAGAMQTWKRARTGKPCFEVVESRDLEVLLSPKEMFASLACTCECCYFLHVKMGQKVRLFDCTAKSQSHMHENLKVRHACIHTNVYLVK